MDVRGKVNRYEDKLATRRSQGGNHDKEKSPINKDTPTDHHSRGGSRICIESRGYNSSHSQYHTLSITKVWKKFKKFAPLIFEGKLDLIEVLEWLKCLEKIFKVIDISS